MYRISGEWLTAKFAQQSFVGQHTRSQTSAAYVAKHTLVHAGAVRFTKLSL